MITSAVDEDAEGGEVRKVKINERYMRGQAGAAPSPMEDSVREALRVYPLQTAMVEDQVMV
jgi:hypothetical protein